MGRFEFPRDKKSGGGGGPPKNPSDRLPGDNMIPLRSDMAKDAISKNELSEIAFQLSRITSGVLYFDRKKEMDKSRKEIEGYDSEIIIDVLKSTNEEQMRAKPEYYLCLIEAVRKRGLIF